MKSISTFHELWVFNPELSVFSKSNLCFHQLMGSLFFRLEFYFSVDFFPFISIIKQKLFFFFLLFCLSFCVRNSHLIYCQKNNNKKLLTLMLLFRRGCAVWWQTRIQAFLLCPVQTDPEYLKNINFNETVSPIFCWFFKNQISFWILK